MDPHWAACHCGAVAHHLYSFPEDVGLVNYQRSLFTGTPKQENFAKPESFYPINELGPAAQPFEFLGGAPLTLPREFEHEGRPFIAEHFLASTDTAALLVLKGCRVRLEHHRLTGDRALVV